MASLKSNNSSLKILHHCKVSPSPPPSTAANTASLPLSCFDLLWLRFHPVERLYFYSIPHLQTSLFHDSILPKLKHSLSLTLQHFLPLAGRIIWPSHSSIPIIQYTPDVDSVSLVIAESVSDFNLLSGNSPLEASISRPFIPHLDSSVSSASVLSLQITLFPNRGFCIGLSVHHAALDGKSSTLFMKAWAHICQTHQGLGESEPRGWMVKTHSPLIRCQGSIPAKLEPFFDRKPITHQDYTDLDILYTNQWLEFENNNQPSLKIMHEIFQPIVAQSARGTFELTRGDIEKLKKRVLEKWDDDDEETKPPPPPQRLSTFVVTIAYVSVCVAKAIEKFKKKRQKFVFTFSVDCRARLEPPVPENYVGNYVMLHIGEEFSEEDGVVVVAKKVENKIREVVEEKGVLDGAKKLLYTFPRLKSKGIEIMGIAGSTQFGVYGIDFGWGRPRKVEITSVDRGLTFGIAESRNGNGGVEVGLVLNQEVMDCFTTIFHYEIESL